MVPLFRKEGSWPVSPLGLGSKQPLTEMSRGLSPSPPTLTSTLQRGLGAPQEPPHRSLAQTLSPLPKGVSGPPLPHGQLLYQRPPSLFLLLA